MIELSKGGQGLAIAEMFFCQMGQKGSVFEKAWILVSSQAVFKIINGHALSWSDAKSRTMPWLNIASRRILEFIDVKIKLENLFTVFNLYRNIFHPVRHRA